MAAVKKSGKLPINLLTGWPNPRLLPVQQLSHAATNALGNPDLAQDLLGYGPDLGFPPLRQSISKWLTQFYKPAEPISADRIAISGGASQNLARILQTYTDPIFTRACFLVAPVYFLACRIFGDSGFDGRMKAVPEDEEGVDLEALRRGLEKSERKASEEGNTKPEIKKPKPWRKTFKYVIYAVPTFSNPSGKTMSMSRREGLVRLAREFDALIITDDVYDMLTWPATPENAPVIIEHTPHPRIVDVDRYLDNGPTSTFGNAISNGSFSKIVSPGCRTGWAEGMPSMVQGISQSGTTKSGGAPSQLTATFINNMLETHVLQNRIQDDLRPVYARRYYKLMDAIDTHLAPLGVRTHQAEDGVAGGYFVWLNLPANLACDADHLCRRALEEEAVSVISGSKFTVDGDETVGKEAFNHNIRLCFAWEDEDLLQEGVARLARVVKGELTGVHS
ncbi:Valine--pyruvate aminotransferase [Exophiala xenobiotica]|nr:Valine--pyruvate aminotransferase [Exophiala xenobiotica]